MGFVLEHVDKPTLIISKYIKYLKPGASLFITVPNSEALNRRFGYEAGLLKDLDQLSEADIQLGHKRYFNKNSLEALVKQCGLTVKTFEGLFLKPITTNQIQTLNLSEKILKAMLKVGVHYPELCTGVLMEATIE
jgi:2-polyprenyl-3-methyl-5-hydroxy-6-metoxy-1,4-benzoquinol methylase